MRCPFCGTDEDRVIDSRPARDGHAIRRRRACSACGHRFTTYEALEEPVVLVMKSNGTREPLDRKKILKGVAIACNKRPVSAEQIEQIVSAVEGRIVVGEGREVTTQQIGQWTMDELLAVDEVAYVRFASVFKRYENLEEFLAELHRIRSGMPESARLD